MEQWKEYKLGDVCYTISDTYKRNASEVVLINTSDVLEGKCLNHSKTANKDLKGQFKKTFQKDDILYSEIRPANKRFAYVDFDATDYIASTKLMVLRHNDKINPQYLFYILKSKSVIEELQMLAESRSGTFPQITFSELANLSVNLPPLNEQQKILSILKSLDDKIELNRQINDNLEQQAQALFKSWFVDNINPNWTEKQLNDICLQITDGVHNSVNDTNNGGYYLLSCKNIKNGQLLISDNEREIDSITFSKLRKRTKLDKGDILLTSVGTIGEMCMLMSEPINIEFQRSVAILKPNTDLISSYFLYELLLNQQSQIKHLAHGAVQQCIFISDLKGFNITVPDKESILKFDNIVSPIFRKKAKLCDEIKSLSQLRDTLLPRLMSGELKINEINC